MLNMIPIINNLRTVNSCILERIVWKIEQAPPWNCADEFEKKYVTIFMSTEYYIFSGHSIDYLIHFLA